MPGIQTPRESWWVTNLINTTVNLQMPPVPILQIGQTIDLMEYVSFDVVFNSIVYRNFVNNGTISTEGYLHTHDDKSSITHTHTGLDVLTAGPASDADSLHTHDGLTTVLEVNTLIENALTGSIDLNDYVRKDGSVNQLSDIISSGSSIENAVSKAHNEAHSLLDHTDEDLVTVSNLTKLMDGSNADCCHTHSFRVHNDLNGLDGGTTGQYYQT